MEKFEKMYKLSTFAMWATRSHPALPQNRFWKLQFSTIISITVITFFWLSNSIIYFDIPAGRYADASKNGIMALVCIVIWFKFFILLYYRSGILELIRIVNGDYEDAQTFSEEEKKLVYAYSKRGVKVCHYWIMSTSITCFVFPCKALYTMAMKYWHGEFELVPVFDFTYPAFIDGYKTVPAMYCFLFLFCSSFGVYAASFYVGFDPLVPIFLLHACGQLELVSRRMKTLFSDPLNEQELNKKLKQLILKLQNIYRFVDNVKSYFTILYEFNLKTTTFMIPLTAFPIVESLRKNEINIEFIAFFVGDILHFYIPCYYSDLLMETSDKLRQAIYMSGWERHRNLRARKQLHFMLMRATVPLVIRTIFYPICLDTFTEMCRTSYALFNLLNAACME